MRISTVALLAVMLTGVTAGVVLRAQRPDAFSATTDHPAIGYATRPVHDRVARLRAAIEAGTARLTFGPESGYLTTLLAALDVPIDSQMLVFSKTSLQAPLIDPRNPRALFFNDDVSVGWVRGGDVLELTAEDPEQGVVFYTLEQKPAATPQLTRQTDQCLLCHLTWDTFAVPGILVISTFRMSDNPHAYASGVVVDHRTPIQQRWGGWFVTGTSVPPRHVGNVPVIVPEAELAKPLVPSALRSVDGRFDTTGYPSRYSDIAALMVFEHQTHMTNLLTRLGWEARVAASTGPAVPPASAAGRSSRPSAADRVRDDARDLVDYMLFVDEAPITAKIVGSSGFGERFSAMGPRDGKGRTLKQLDLTRRLLRYPCSYMIYSDAFDGLPAGAKDTVYRRLWQILSRQDSDARYAGLTLADRRAIVEILRDTKKDLPGYFQVVAR